MSDASSSGSAAVVLPPMELVCPSDFLVIGFQEGEKPTSVLRTVCTLITVSIISSWCSRRNIARLLLFFSHWLRCVRWQDGEEHVLAAESGGGAKVFVFVLSSLDFKVGSRVSA